MSDLLDKVASLTPADVDILDGMIADLGRDIDWLRAVKAMLTSKPQRARPRGITPALATSPAAVVNGHNVAQDLKRLPGTRNIGQVREDRRDAALRELAALMAGGPRRLAELAEELEKPISTVHSRLKHPWFAQSQEGAYKLTETGRRDGLAPLERDED